MQECTSNIYHTNKIILPQNQLPIHAVERERDREREIGARAHTQNVQSLTSKQVISDFRNKK
jgi:hypothetical protein